MNLTFNNNPLLSGLANHGGAALPGDAGDASKAPISAGPPLTHVLLANSPAIDAGSDDLAKDPLSPFAAFTTDQRGTGFLRKVDIPGYGTGPYIVDIGAVELNVPKIVGVTIATTGTTSVSAPYDVPVGSGEQLRTVPVGQANQVVIHFSEDVTVVQGNLTWVSNQGNTYSIATGGFSYSSTNQTATWTFASAFLPDQIEIDVSGSTGGVSGLAGLLDGEWTNPTSLSQSTSSTWPSGNGTAGGNFAFYVTILPGDATNNGTDAPNNIINLQDMLNVKNNFGLHPATWIQGDTDGDGTVNLPDLLNVKNYFGTDFSHWPSSGGGMMMMLPSGGGQDWERIEKIRSILDDAFGDLTPTSVVAASWLNATLDEVIALIS